MALTIADQQHRLSRKGMTAVRNLRELKRQQDELSVKIKAAEAVLKAELEPALGEKAVGTDARGNPLVSVTSSIVRTISTAMLRKRNPELAEECTTESSRVRVTLAPVDPA